MGSMTPTARRRRTAVLDRLIEHRDNTQSGEIPWWRDTKKLIRRAFAEARDFDENILDQLRMQIVMLAKRDERWRRELIEHLKELGPPANAPGQLGRQKIGNWRTKMVRGAVQAIMKSKPEECPSISEACAFWERVWAAGHVPDLAVKAKTLEGLYYAADGDAADGEAVRGRGRTNKPSN